MLVRGSAALGVALGADGDVLPAAMNRAPADQPGDAGGDDVSGAPSAGGDADDRLAVGTMPSLAPRTAALSQFERVLR